MRVLAACSLGGPGHWQPMLPLLRASARAGHEVLAIAPPALQEMVEHDGFRHRAGQQPPEELIASIRGRLPVSTASEASVLGNRELFGRLATAAMLPSMRATCAEWKPDLILRDPAEYASAVVAGDLGIPIAQVACSLADVEWGSIEVAAPALEEHRFGLVHEARATPYLSKFPASLDPSPFATTLRFHELATGVTPRLPDWWEGSRAPLIYLTFGTVLGHMSIAANLYRTAMSALEPLEARVLLTVGRHFDPAVLGAAPSNVHVERWIDQDRVLADAEVVVCHGGSGTVFGALAAGVPLVVLPVFADQFRNGQLVDAHGLGVSVVSDRIDDRSRAVLDDRDLDRITEAVRFVLNDRRHRERAQTVAAEMLATPTADLVLEHITDTWRSIWITERSPR